MLFYLGLVVFLFFFFFFQAEDGIRDLIVTGVQTCALPICGDLLRRRLELLRRRRELLSHRRQLLGLMRSEEHTSELQSRSDLVCRLLLEKKKKIKIFTVVNVFNNIGLRSCVVLSSLGIETQ